MTKLPKELNPKTRALDLLTRRNYTSAELQDKLLIEGYDEKEVVAVIAWLQQIGYIDDFRTAELWVDSRNRYRPTGVLGLKHELLQKGIPEEIIDKVINTPEQDYKLALKLAQARLTKLSELPKYKQYQRIGSLLQRRGFSADVIYRVLETVFASSLDTDH